MEHLDGRFSRGKRSSESNLSPVAIKKRQIVKDPDQAAQDLVDFEVAYQYLSDRIMVQEKELADHEEREAQMSAAEEDVFGRWRLHITSDRFHTLHPDAAMTFFGFESWEITKQMVEIFFDLKHVEPEPSWVTGKKRLTEFERCLLALMFYETDLDQLQRPLY